MHYAEGMLLLKLPDRVETFLRDTPSGTKKTFGLKLKVSSCNLSMEVICIKLDFKREFLTRELLGRFSTICIHTVFFILLMQETYCGFVN